MRPHQRSLFAVGEPALDANVTTERIALDERSWVEVARNWLTGADAVLDALVDAVDWRQGRRRMWDRMVDDPRLSRWYRDGDPLPHPVFAEVRDALSCRYGARLGTVGLNYYRDAPTALPRTPTGSCATSTTVLSRSSRSAPAGRSCCDGRVAASRSTSHRLRAISS